MTQAKWTGRMARASLGAALLALLATAAGLTLARYDVIGKLDGLYAMLLGAGMSVVALVAGVIALIMAMIHRTATKRIAIIGMVIAAAYLGYMGSRAAVARSVPALHDISTDVDAPPAFSTLTLRADNMAGVGTLDNWRAMHRAAYGDLDTISVAKPVATVLRDAERLARARGWTIAAAGMDAAGNGQLEGSASVSYIRFMDDVVIRIVPTADGTGSSVDMRSVSRVGVSDLGVNAARIREFLTALQAA